MQIKKLKKLGMHIVRKIHFEEHIKFEGVIKKILLDQYQQDFD